MQKRFNKFLSISAAMMLGLPSLMARANSEIEQVAYSVESRTTPIPFEIDVSNTVKTTKKLTKLSRLKELNNWINSSQQTDFIPSNMEVDYLDVPKLDEKGFEPGLTIKIFDKCHILFSGKDFQTQFINSNGDRTIKSPLSDKINLTPAQSLLETEFVFFHEVGHCKKVNMHDTVIFDKPIISNTLSTFFSDSNESEYSSAKTSSHVSPSEIFDETYSDVYGAMLLIKKNGLTDDVLKILEYISIKRIEDANQYKKEKNSIESHTTGFALKELLKYDNLAKIANSINSPQKLDNLAKQISSIALKKTLSSYGFTSGAMFSVKAFESKAYSYFSRYAYNPTQLEINHNGSNYEMNNLKDVGIKTYLELDKKYNLSSKNNSYFLIFNFRHKQEIRDVLNKNLTQLIEEFKIKNNIKEQDILDPLRQYINTLPVEDIPSDAQLSQQINRVAEMEKHEILDNILELKKTNYVSTYDPSEAQKFNIDKK